MLKKILKAVLGTIGMEIRRKQANSNQVFHYNDGMKNGLERFRKLNYTINTIVDVGAAQGYWALSAKAFWPNASFLLFEPLSERKDELESLSREHSNFHYISAAAGKEKGKIRFAVTDDLDGSGVTRDENSTSGRSVDVTSIQDEIGKLKVKGPILIKLDTHGYEVPILEGCKDIIHDVSAFIIECYGFHVTNNSLLFWQMCQHMEGMGYRLFDIVDIMHRPKDNAFWQCDAIFIRKDDSLFKDNMYQ